MINVSTSKTGKHGHAKCNFTATDIFTGKKRRAGAAESVFLSSPDRRNPQRGIPQVFFIIVGGG